VLQTLAAFGTRRRIVAMALATPLLMLGFLRAAAVPVGELAVGWLVVGLVAAVLGSAVLASYLPVSGWRPDLGCSPCAAVAALTLVGAVLAIGSYGASVLGPGLAVAVTLFGLTQRLDNAACATPPTQ
jgi:hypothetical protein